MPLFTSSREKRLWLCAFLVLLTIFSTLFLGQPFAELLASQDVQAVFFLLVMVLVAAAIIAHGLKTKPNRIEITLLLGMAAVYIMFFLRLGLTERSHLMEYSILAIFIHMALKERLIQRKHVYKPALLAFIVTFLIGVLDECIQIFLPNRVFDINDILFNGLASLMAIGSALALNWVHKRIKKIN